MRYTQRLAASVTVASVGSTGDSYQQRARREIQLACAKPNSSATRSVGNSIDDLKSPSRSKSTGHDHRRLHGEIGLVPPIEFAEEHYRHNFVASTVAALVQSFHGMGLQSSFSANARNHDCLACASISNVSAESPV